MGREVRRVPVDWEPPDHPHHDETYEHARAAWQAGKARWESGEDPDSLRYRQYSWEDWHGEEPDDPAYYRPEWPEGTPLGYCYYTTVTEGNALSPVFATSEELADWLVSHEGMSPEGARRFVEAGWAPSLISSSSTGVITGMQAIDRGAL